jgi:hypothetical protein
MKVTLIKVDITKRHKNARYLNVTIACRLFTYFKSVKNTLLRFLTVLSNFVLALNCLHSVIVA